MRVCIFENMLRSVEEGRINLEIFNDSKFNSPDNLFVELYNNSFGFELLYSEAENMGSNKLYSANFYIPIDKVSNLKEFFETIPFYLINCDYTIPKDNITNVICDMITKGKYLN